MVFHSFPNGGSIFLPMQIPVLLCGLGRVISGIAKALTLAHSMSRAKIDQHHEGTASRVSAGLIHEDALAAIFEKYLTVTVKISDEHMYQATGTNA